MRTHSAHAANGSTVVVYVSAPFGHSKEPLLAACRSHADVQGWRVSAELSDEPLADSRQPRPGWRQAKRFVVTGLARGILTYALPMVTTKGNEDYTDVLNWVEERASFLAAAWRPSQGAVVHDTVAERTGIIVALDPVGGVAWLRATTGGRYWTTAPEALHPAGPARVHDPSGGTGDRA
ncbi:hypothetical protein [Streptomyces sp. I05A-00742]|uniref:hypothetical protein n=1 Tax=Streptomyces sp. I05A-00742 TaxID=2732853 RepID=UPI0014884988|nr:hypothetical protein [Streptomyces sp. I05A-00742]